MSGTSSTNTCPRCGGSNLQCYSDYKPHDVVSGICFDCGFRYDTVAEIATLLEVNEERGGHDLAPIEELAKPLEEWLKWGYEPKVSKEA